jgi:hypothetical protein
MQVDTQRGGNGQALPRRRAVLPAATLAARGGLVPQLGQAGRSLRAGFSSRLAKWNRIRWFTGSRKKLDPGTAATPTSRASHSHERHVVRRAEFGHVDHDVSRRLRAR